MQVRVLTLKYNEAQQGFPEEVLQKATFGREVLSVSEHYFVYGNVPHLTLVLTLGDAAHYDNSESYRKRDPNAPDPETLMPEAAIPFYRALKKWRNETAKEEGRPAYAIARNTQFVELVKMAPTTLAGLKEIDGFGEAFCEKYGKKVLSLIAEMPHVDPLEKTEEDTSA